MAPPKYQWTPHVLCNPKYLHKWFDMDSNYATKYSTFFLINYQIQMGLPKYQWAPHVLCNPKYEQAKKYLCNSWSGPLKKYALMSNVILITKWPKKTIQLIVGF